MLDSFCRIFDKAVNEKLLLEVESLLQLSGFKYGWHSNREFTFSHWDHAFSSLVAASKNRAYVRHELPSPVLKLWESFQPNVLPEHPVLIRCYANGYTFGNDGYIHQDSNAAEDMTAIVYLNRNWNPNWGGETVLLDKDGEISRAILPRWGRLITFPSTSLHVGRGVSRICPQLRTVLVFKARPETGYTLDVDRASLVELLVNIGADTRRHSQRMLIDHLLGTYDLLKKWGCERWICIGGGLHSIYGTNVFTMATLKEDSRQMLRERFGEEAECITWLFSCLDRPKAIEEGIGKNRFDNSLIDLSDKTLSALRLIEAANLIEQGSKAIQMLPTIRATMLAQINSRN